MDSVIASFGNAFLAALALGHVKRQDINLWNKTFKVVHSTSNSKLSAQYQTFKKLYKATSHLMK